MRVLHGLDAIADLPRGAGLSIGNFDGLHIGHQRILDALGAGVTAIVTFEPHPATVLRPELAPPRLSTAEQKRDLLAAAGIDAVLELPPTREVLGLRPLAFWERLRDAVRPERLIEGEDFRFGKARAGDVEMLRTNAGDTEVVTVAPATAVLSDLSVVDVGSSLIRWLIAHGRLSDAARCLGRPYRLAGSVIRGYGRGKQLGIPTANLATEQLVPADGVYAATVGGQPAAVSIGVTPTFDGARRQVEVHILDTDADLYEKPLAVDMHHWVRPQVKFAGVDQLVTQLHRDFDQVRESLAAAVSTSIPRGTLPAR
ncbi:MAG: bifunctional riboflavin kinase/FMN adenylyltransferase [Planctomycetota bacterium]